MARIAELEIQPPGAAKDLNVPSGPPIQCPMDMDEMLDLNSRIGLWNLEVELSPPSFHGIFYQPGEVSAIYFMKNIPSMCLNGRCAEK